MGWRMGTEKARDEDMYVGWLDGNEGTGSNVNGRLC